LLVLGRVDPDPPIASPAAVGEAGPWALRTRSISWWPSRLQPRGGGQCGPTWSGRAWSLEPRHRGGYGVWYVTLNDVVLPELTYAPILEVD
jgi:hypothetical protein